MPTATYTASVTAARADAARKLWPWPAADDQRAPLAWLAGLTALAAVLRVIAIDQQLWYDEITTLVNSVRLPLGQILTTYESQNVHMFYSVLARLSVTLFGEHIWSLRLPAVVFGVACVPALYFCAREWVERHEALLACALLAVSYHHVWFSQNARGYTGLVFWTLLTTAFFIRAARGDRGAWWAWYGAAMALGMYTHLTMGFVAAGHGLVYLWLLFSRRRELQRVPAHAKAPLLGLLAAGALALLLYAPVLPQIFQRTVGSTATSAAVKTEWSNPLWAALETLRGLAAGAGGAAGFVALPIGAAILLAGMVCFWMRNRFTLGLIVLPGVITACVMLVLEHNLWPRFFFCAIGFAFVLLVRGAMVWGDLLTRFVKNRERAPQMVSSALVTLMLLASAIWLRPAYLYPKQDFEGAMRFADETLQPGENVVVAGLARLPYQEYFRRDWPAVETAEQLRTHRQSGNSTLLLYVFPVFLESRYPEVWHIVQTEFETLRVFRGTLGGGEIYVCRSKPLKWRGQE